MALKKVTERSMNEATDKSKFSVRNYFLSQFKEIKFKSGNTYKVRLLPPNNDEKRFQGDFNSVGLCVHEHLSGKDWVLCSEHIAPRLMVKCPFCEQYRNKLDVKSAKLSTYYYINLILLSEHDGLPKKGSDGKFIVYTVRASKKQMWASISDYYKKEDRTVKDPADIIHGCTVDITVTEQVVGKDKYPNYKIEFREAQKGDLTTLINVDAIKDLRLITEFIPTQNGYNNILEGMPVADAIDVFGKYSTATGEQIGGAPETRKTSNAGSTSDSIPPPPDEGNGGVFTGGDDLPLPPGMVDDIIDQPMS